MTDPDQVGAPPPPNSARDAWSGLGSAVPQPGPPPMLDTTRSLRGATNLKRIQLPTDVSAPALANDAVSPPEPARQAQPVDLPPHRASPTGSPLGLPAASLPSPIDATPLDTAALPERAEEIPWPSEMETPVAWARPQGEPGQPTLPRARSWPAPPLTPTAPRTEDPWPTDLFVTDALPLAEEVAPTDEPVIGANLPTIDLAAHGLAEAPEHVNGTGLPPLFLPDLEEPTDYFPISMEGDTTIRLPPEPPWPTDEAADPIRPEVSLAGLTDQTVLLPPTAPPVDVVSTLDSFLDSQSELAQWRAEAAHPAVRAAPAIDLGGGADATEPPTGDLPTESDPADEGRAGGSLYGGLAEQLLEVFKEEAVEMLDILHSSLETLERGPSASALIEARRTVHTMKGSARMCGLPAITELAHGCEDLIGQPASGQDSLTPTLVALLFEAETELRAAVTRPASGPGSDPSLRGLTTRLHGARLRPPTSPTLPVAPVMRGAEPAPVRLNERQALLRRPILTSISPTNNRLAVDLTKIEAVVAKATEIIANRATSHALVETLSATVGELTHNVQRLQLLAMNLQYQIASQGLDSTAEQDPDGLALETYGPIKQLMLQLQEAVSDQQALVQEAQDSVTNKRALASLETRLDTDLQASLMSMRMLPLSQLRVRLDQVVRSAAASAEREVRWTMEGQETALDKHVCDRLFEPLMHLLRNAVGHGIEPPEEREAQGKPRAGSIVVTAVLEGNQVVITVSDDGRGIDPARIVAKAIAKGIISAEQAAMLSAREQMELVFRPGFSTAEAVTELSGRGMGMEIIRESCTRMGGAITIGGRSQGGTVITLTVPLTLSIVHTLLVRDAGRVLAIPASQVASVHLVNPASIAGHGFGQAVRIGQAQVPLYSLPGSDAARPRIGEDQERSILLIPYRGRYAALMVDELINEEDAIVKPLPLLLQGVDRLLGAIVLPDGKPAPVINLPPLLNTLAGSETIAPPLPPPPSAEQVVLVVDDSLTMRVALSQSLSHGGYTVLTARDGQEALETIRTRGLPDLITLDIEMPRMDGLETLYAIRNTPGGESLPIFMITSRTGRQHQRTAMQMGATRYFTKPYRDSEFIGAVQQATGKILRSTG
jgi:chemosensory pili system protein ChpA (sensor histidine kinase/response regulator)